MNPRHDPLDHEERALARLLPGDDAVAPDAADAPERPRAD